MSSLCLKIVEEDLNKLTDDDLFSKNIQEWYNFYFSERDLGLKKLVLFVEQKEMSQESHSDITVLSYHIPYDGSPSALFTLPTTFVDNKYKFGLCCGDNLEDKKLIINIDIYNNQFQEIEVLELYVKHFIDDRIEYLNRMISFVNIDIDEHNKRLMRLIENTYQARKSNHDKIMAISRKLKIPLKKDSNIQSNINVLKPNRVQSQSLSHLGNQEYEEIIKIIHNIASNMETTANSFNLLEEAIRDTVLSGLKSHYNNAYGEVFRKNGKTDITIENKDKAAFVAEFKIWQGLNNLEKAKKQLFSYLIWKDKSAIVLFNKKTMTLIIYAKQ